MRAVTLEREYIHSGSLILVNQDYPIKENKLLPSFVLTPVDTQHKEILLEKRACTLLTQLFHSIDCKNNIIPVSGYRSSKEQEDIYQESLQKNGSAFTRRYVAAPNCSEHQSGLAIDLSENADGIDFIRPNFPNTGICGVFRKACVNHGFIERYGKGKEDITGISHEPWHFRYVGYPHSQIMKDNNLSLEEYIRYLKDFPCTGRHLHYEQEKRAFELFYAVAGLEKTVLCLPDNDCYQISGNNVDGFIVTIWRR